MTGKEACAPSEPPLIEADHVSIGYRRRIVASGICLRIGRGERWGVLGPNGAGKTTLIRTLMGAVRPLAGTVRHARALRFGYVKQRDALHDLYPFTVAEVVETGRYRDASPFYRPRDADREAIERALTRTGIASLRDRAVRELSGGQKQRVLLARALCAEPDVIVMDEPTNDMDIAGEAAVLALIQDVQAQTGAAVIIISHLLHAVLQTAEQLVFIDGRRTEVFSRDDFVNQNHLERFYGMPIRVTRHEDGGYAVAVARPGATSTKDAGHGA